MKFHLPLGLSLALTSKRMGRLPAALKAAAVPSECGFSFRLLFGTPMEEQPASNRYSHVDRLIRDTACRLTIWRSWARREDPATSYLLSSKADEDHRSLVCWLVNCCDGYDFSLFFSFSLVLAMLRINLLVEIEQTDCIFWVSLQFFNSDVPPGHEIFVV